MSSPVTAAVMSILPSVAWPPGRPQGGAGGPDGRRCSYEQARRACPEEVAKGEE